MATAVEPTELSDAEMDSQLQQASLREEAGDKLCPICLSAFKNPSYINICFHIFCLSCIQKWTYMNCECPICRLPFDRILHTVRADDNYQEYKVGATNSQRGRGGRRRGRSRPLQRRYFLRPRPTINEPIAGVTGLRGRQRGGRRGRGRGTLNGVSHQDTLEYLTRRMEGPVLRSHVQHLRTQFSEHTEI